MVVNRMKSIITAGTPLVLPQNLNAFPKGDYMKYLPRYNGEGEVIVEENMVSFYIFAYNFKIEHADVWMRLFVQSLDGKVRKWFHRLNPVSITGIEALYKDFLKECRDRRNYLYYIIEFGDLRRKNGESVSDFTKMFNKMYNNEIMRLIPLKLQPRSHLQMLLMLNFLSC
jgi:hypothetical protein